MNSSALKNVACLGDDFKLFMTLFDCASCFNEFYCSQDMLARYLKKSRQTVSKHLHNLVESGAILYKYSGHGYINPAFMFKGKEELIDIAMVQFINFKNDM